MSEHNKEYRINHEAMKAWNERRAKAEEEGYKKHCELRYQRFLEQQKKKS